MQKARDGGAPELEFFVMGELAIGGGRVRMLRRSIIGLMGFEFVGPGVDAVKGPLGEAPKNRAVAYRAPYPARPHVISTSRMAQCSNCTGARSLMLKAPLHREPIRPVATARIRFLAYKASQ